MKVRKYVLALSVGMSLLSLVFILPRASSKPAFENNCKDPIDSCKNPKPFGHEGKCWCFYCEGNTVVCTSDDKDKDKLFDAEAASNKASVLKKLSDESLERLATIGIIEKTPALNPINRNANANSGNSNATPPN